LLGLVGILLGSGKTLPAGEWSPEYLAVLRSTARKQRELRERKVRLRALKAARDKIYASEREEKRLREQERDEK
jgi:hypothetical protein